MELGGDRIAAFQGQGHQLLQPAEPPQFLVPGFGEQQGRDCSPLEAIEQAAAFIELDGPLEPAAPALLGVELVAQPLEIAGGEQVVAEQVAAQLGPGAAAGE